MKPTHVPAFGQASLPRGKHGKAFRPRPAIALEKRTAFDLCKRTWPLLLLAGFSGFMAGALFFERERPTSATERLSNTTQSSTMSSHIGLHSIEVPVFSLSSHKLVSGSVRESSSSVLESSRGAGTKAIHDVRLPLQQSPEKAMAVQVKSNGTAILDSASGFYDFTTAPMQALEFARKWISSDPTCEQDHTKLQVACCRAHCGGISDRAKGLLALALVASKVGRQLCFNENYFLSGPWPRCEEGSYLYISHQKSEIYNTPWVKAGVGSHPNRVIQVVPEELDALPKNPAIEALYIASSYAAKSVAIHLTKGRADAKRFGMMAIAVSGVLDKKMKDAKNMLREGIGSELGTSYTSLNIRCGECVFKLSTGEDALGSDNQGFHDGIRPTSPNQILGYMRQIPRETTCQRALHISTDSALFMKEVQIAIPSGLKALSCCASPIHVGFGPASMRAVSKNERLQHLVDLIAMSESERMFRGDGGFSELGAMTKSWAIENPMAVSRKWNSSADAHRQHRSFMNQMLRSLHCDHVIP